MLRTSFLFISLLSLGKTVMAAPNLTSDNPLYKYSKDEKGQSRTKFKIDYRTLVEYYHFAAKGLLTPADSVNLKMKNFSPAKLAKEDLLFEVNMNKMNISPVLPLFAESAQDLFQFNLEAYMSLHPGKDFVSAKKNAYQKQAFFKETQHFDRDFLHMSDWRSLSHPPIKKLDNNLDIYYKDKQEIPTDSKMLTADFNRELDQVSSSELTKGNKLKLLVNNLSFEEKMKRIRSAKRSILVGVMTFASDPSAMKMIDLLIARKKEGIDVQIIVEGLWGSLFFRKSLNKIIEGGIKLMLADDMLRMKDEKHGLFHNKIWIFDEEVAIVGGQNIVNSANSSTGFNHWNKETDALIEGPMVTDILRDYLLLKKRYEHRHLDSKEKKFNLGTGNTAGHYASIIERREQSERAQGLRGQENYLTWFSNKDSASSGICRFVIQGPQKDKFAISKAYIKLVEASQDHIYFVSQHIEYDMTFSEKNESWATKFYRSVYKRAEEGVKIDLLANGIDGGFAEIGQNVAGGEKSERHIRRLEKKFARQEKKGKEHQTFFTRLSENLGLKGTLKFVPYLDHAAQNKNFNAWMHFQYIHSKTILIDNIMASVGSYNFEPYSADHSHESAILCYDQTFARELKVDTVRDIVNSTPVFPYLMVE